MEINILQWKTTKEAALLYGIAPSTLVSAVADARIPPPVAVKRGRVLFFDVDHPGWQEYLSNRPAPGRGPKKKAAKG